MTAPAGHASKPARHRFTRQLRKAKRDVGILSYGLLTRLGLKPRETHVTICGVPRSGTSLLYNMICMSLEDTFSCDDFELTSTTSILYPGNHASKRPMDIMDLQQIQARNYRHKKLIVLAVIRDPRDTITSIHPKVPGEYFIGYRDCMRVLGNFPDYHTDRDHPGIGELWALIQSEQARLGESFMLLRYEDLVDRPNDMQDTLAERFALPFKHRFSDFHERMAGAKVGVRYDGEHAAVDQQRVFETSAVTRNRVGKWHEGEFRQRVLDEFEANPDFAQTLIEMGYEQDTAWLDELKTNADGG